MDQVVVKAVPFDRGAREKQFLYWAMWHSGARKYPSLKHTHTHGDVQLKENEDEVGHSTAEELALPRTCCKFSVTDLPF